MPASAPPDGETLAYAAVLAVLEGVDADALAEAMGDDGEEGDGGEDDAVAESYTPTGATIARVAELLEVAPHELLLPEKSPKIHESTA